MTIPGKIDDIKTIKADIRNAIVAKGVTVAANTAFADYPSKISQIEGGSEPLLQSKTFTASSTTPTLSTVEPDSGYDGLDEVGVDLSYIENRLSATNGGGTVPTGGIGITREVDANGGYGMPTESFTFSLPSSATSLKDSAMWRAFYGCTSLTSVDLSSLTTINGQHAMDGAFQDCTSLVSVDLSSLISASGTYAMQDAFVDCTGLTSVDLSSLTTLSGNSYVMCQTFYNCTDLSSVDLSNLTTVSCNSAMLRAFNNCISLTSADLPSLTTLSSQSAMSYAFYGCTGLTSVNLSNLSILSGERAMYNIFYGCTGLTSVSFPSLTVVSGMNAMNYTFYKCTSLTSLSFPALTSTFNIPESGTTYTNQFSSMLQGVTGCTVHFPSNLEEVIGSWASVTAGFGGTNTTVLFDLPATT